LIPQTSFAIKTHPTKQDRDAHTESIANLRATLILDHQNCLLVAEPQPVMLQS
jgi:hypothetical protein